MISLTLLFLFFISKTIFVILKQKWIFLNVNVLFQVVAKATSNLIYFILSYQKTKSETN